MESLYFVCHWIIRPHTNYTPLINVSNKLNCELAIKVGSMKTIDGYNYFDFFVKVDSNQTLNNFIDLAGKEAQMINWIPTSAEYYSQGFLLADFLDIRTPSPLMLTKWLDEVNMMGRVNEALEKKLKLQN